MVYAVLRARTAGGLGCRRTAVGRGGTTATRAARVAPRAPQPGGFDRPAGRRPVGTASPADGTRIAARLCGGAAPHASGQRWDGAAAVADPSTRLPAGGAGRRVRSGPVRGVGGRGRPVSRRGFADGPRTCRHPAGRGFVAV